MTADNLSKTVVSTRVRLARNLEGYPFPSHLKDEKQAKEIIRLVSSGLIWTEFPKRKRFP